MKPTHFIRKNDSKQILFLLLLSAVLVVCLLSGTQTFPSWLTRWCKQECVSCTREGLDFNKPSPQVKMSRSEPEAQRCSYTYLSPENQKEGRRLLDSILHSWPETPPLPKGFSLNATTCAAKSFFTIEPARGGWRMGDELVVKIQLNDFNGNPKKSGGDFIISRLYNQKLGAGVVGRVLDHLNGTFTAVFPLLWNGTADVEVMLDQTSESITVLKRLKEKEPGGYSFASDFWSGSVAETSTCNVCLDPDKAPLCNFTDLSTGEQWFCYKPKTLDCSTRVSHKKSLALMPISKEENALFQSGINMKAPIKALYNLTVMILPRTGETKKMSLEPSGYYYNKQWRPLRGHPVRAFNNASAINACLKGKRLHMLGDSTVRQYYRHLVARQNLLTFDKGASFQCGPFLAVDHTNDIMVTHRCHGPPILAHPVFSKHVTYVANELDRIMGGSNTVVVIGVWAHFAPFPLEVYYQRVMTIVKAVNRLLNTFPKTKVIVRSPNPREIYKIAYVGLSNWHGHQMNKVLRAMFKDTRVFILEAWDMVQASDLPHSLHPHPETIKLMVDQILSITCP